MKDKLIGTIVTLITSCAMFLFYSYFNSFETKAASKNKYDGMGKKFDKIDSKLNNISCYLQNKKMECFLK